MNIKPLFEKKHCPHIGIYGRMVNNEVIDWSLRQFQTNTDIETNPKLFARIDKACRRSGVMTVYAPSSSTANKRIAEPKDFQTCIQQGGSVQILRGVKADGAVIPRWSGFLGTPADCPYLIAWRRSDYKMVVAHAGRESLLDRKVMQIGLGTHMFQTVVKNVLEHFCGKSFADLQFFITCYISGESFLHPMDHPDPIFAGRNRTMINYIARYFGSDCFHGEIKYGKFNLGALITRQLQVFGEIDPGQVSSDGLDTFSDKDKCGNFSLHSHVRTRSTPEDQMRNLLIIANVP